MQLGLGLGGSRRRWRPEALFASGEQGALYDASDISTLFQDAAGTTPVTDVGQRVGKMLDKSGRGNHLTQTTGTARPILQQDAGGFYYLSFDGVDDSLFTAAIGVALPQPASMVAAVRMSATTGLQNIVDVDVPGPAPSTTNRYQFGIRTGSFEMYSGTVANIRLANTTQNHVLVARFNGAASEGRDNGVVSAPLNPGVNSPLVGSRIAVGSASAPSSEYMLGFLFGGLFINRALTDPETILVQRYFGSKCGVVL